MPFAYLQIGKNKTKQNNEVCAEGWILDFVHTLTTIMPMALLARVQVYSIKINLYLGVVVHTCNVNIWEAEAQESRFKAT